MIICIYSTANQLTNSGSVRHMMTSVDELLFKFKYLVDELLFKFKYSFDELLFNYCYLFY